MRIFAESDLREYFESKTHALQQEVHGESREKLLNVNETQYIAYLSAKYRIDPLIIHWENISVTDFEQLIPADQHPSGFMFIDYNKSFPRQVIRYHIPYSGDRALLSGTPNTRIMWTEDVTVSVNEITFDVINWRGKIDEVKRESDHIISNIKQQAAHVTADVDQFNSNIEATASSTFLGRKQSYLEQLDLMQSLGVPMKKSNNVPATFTVPIKKRAIIVKPQAPSSSYSPEPTLEESIFQAILTIINDAGVEMERHPSIYAGKDEETLRDHFLMVLAPHFESATGESFNKSGKTDILVREDKNNVFVAECKIWKGAKAYHETIDQLLNYLTWRDSKAAVILFVRNKELQPVLDQIENETSKHSCFIKSYGKSKEGWFNFELHLPGDNTRSVKSAVLCFHFP